MSSSSIGMRATTGLGIAACLGLAVAPALPALAQEKQVEVVVCETLVALRLLTASATSSSDAASHLSAHPACRLVPRADLGEVTQRAMIGGAPFECLSIRGSQACAWVAP